MNAKLITILFILAALTYPLAAQWKIPASAPLLTRWAKEVNPQRVHPEYPRPQLVREVWLNLNGLWQYSEAAEGEAPPTGKLLAGSILVPFPIESALSGVMKSAERLWYRRTIVLPKSWNGRRIILNFGAVDWEATVFVNGREIGQHRGGYDPFSFDITDALTKSGPQEIIVGVFDPTDGGNQPRGKQVLKPKSIWYTPTSGIWQTVWLEPVAESHISDLHIVPDVDSKKVRITVHATGDGSDQSVRIVVLENGRATEETEGKPGEEIAIPLRSVKLWSPENPFLYDLKITLLRSGKTLDAVKSYFGMRKIEIGTDSSGVKRILLNGSFVMQVGPLDQGFWPDGLYTAPSDKALRYDLEMTTKLGFNMTRKHVKVEPDRWYYWADKLGVLVWQDMPSANNKTDESKKQFETEFDRLIMTHRNHPSIIMWVVFNEGWGQYDTERLTAWVKNTDPSRLVNNASGWTDKKSGDVLDIHNYPAPKAPLPDSVRAIVLGEFGGLGLAVDGHTWKKEHWGYQGMTDAEQLTSKYEKFMKTVYDLKENPGLSAAIYTQITDVEIECNGLMTYDRALVKPVLKRIAAVNRGDFSLMPPPPVIRVVVPTSEGSPQTWHYTLEEPATGWFAPQFDDTGWKRGNGGFGTKGTPGAVVGTEWTTPDIWLRRVVTIQGKTVPKLFFRLHHDDEAELYVNGVLAGTFAAYTTEYGEFSLNAAGERALRLGENILAVHCHQTEGGQFIDVGLVEVIPRKK